MQGKIRAAAVISIFLSTMECNSMQDFPVSDHFDGDRFHYNKEESASDFKRPAWYSRMAQSLHMVDWPAWVENQRYEPPQSRVNPGRLRITYINHASTLIQFDGVNILTDPVWSERASPFSWLGPKRIRAPGIALENLPPIDAILISHNHYDHLDITTLKKLAIQGGPRVLTGLAVGELLRNEGIDNVTELDWWQHYDVKSLRFTFVPARHSSGRGLFDSNKTLWGGFVVQSGTANVYFAGDTAYGMFLEDIKNQFKKFDLALLPVGHYLPRWMMYGVHMSPDDAVRAHQYLDVRQSVGMHFGTFHGFGGHNVETVDEHEHDLKRALQRYRVPESEFLLLGFGEGRDIF